MPDNEHLDVCMTCGGRAELTTSGQNVVCSACGLFEDRCTCEPTT
jgi:hypothetical protein